MCGITVKLARATHTEFNGANASDAIWETLVAQNSCRGPDLQNTHDLTLPNGLVLSLTASVLHMRGTEPRKQPHVSSAGNVLCWNGEIFEGMEIAPEENDGALLFAALNAASSASSIVQILAQLEGPYAFVYFSANENALYFARDPAGRRSLLMQQPSEDAHCFILSSTSAGHASTPHFEEVSAEHILRLDLASVQTTLHIPVDALSALSRSTEGSSIFSILPTINRAISHNEERLTTTDTQFSDAVTQLLTELDRSVRLRVQHVPPLPAPSPSTSSGPPARVAVLFSGGIDSTTIACLADRHVPPNEPIDLLNVAFENPRRLKGQQSVGRKAKAVANAKAAQHERMQSTYMVPDRITGLEEIEELRALCPQRQWNFVEVNVTYEEATAARPTIATLMHPSQTMMDLSLGSALYFASRGKGIVRSVDGTERPYHSRARVILSGLGSDELLGGYSRHRRAFLTASWEGLIDELQLDLTRIPTRNMGRDDRIISSHGKEARYPFLSLSVVSFLASLPVHVKLDPRLSEGVGDKMLLRAAATQLGLTLVSRRKKRAMQFGSASARMEDGAPKHGDNTLEQVGIVVVENAGQ